jgi:hypothetical protein
MSALCLPFCNSLLIKLEGKAELLATEQNKYFDGLTGATSVLSTNCVSAP